MSEQDTIFASVLLPLPVPGNYTYRVPREWNDLLQIGQRVVVPFGARRIYAGIVTDFSDLPPEGYNASYIIEILDDDPLISPSQLKFWHWVANYYMCYPGEVMAAALPAGFRLQSETVLVLNPEFDESSEMELDEKEWLILEALHRKKELRIEEAADVIGLKSPMKYIKSLYQRGIVLMHEEVKENYKPKFEIYLELSPAWESDEYAKTNLEQLEKRAPKQAAVILALLGHGKGAVAMKLLADKYRVGAAAVSALEEKGLILKLKREVGRLVPLTGGDTTFELTNVQQQAAAEVQSAFDNGQHAVLHGVTGSGKTFVYMHFMRQALEAGKQVLYLLPEVALTEHLVQRLSVYFGDKLGVWHNFYSSQEKTELYAGVRNGNIRILLGARSAVFAPFANLGLVVVDEEHENTFKQFEKRPHYHGRDTAIHLASLQHCNVLLGSATPSYEMLQLCREGKMKWVNLGQRYVPTPDPRVVLIHTGEAKRQHKMKQAFSVTLLEEMQKVMDAKGQIIVYQNRKGYVPFISCDMCGYTAHCINCDITLTYYKGIHAQKCSYCGYSQEPQSSCPACGSTSISMRGYGTERIAEELAIFFPEARITRFDQDSIRKRSDFQRILNAFANAEIDILVGTQLLSKGLDFKNIGLVAVVDADMLLNVPDFRSNERAYQQLHQVSGRAGRGNRQGLAVIQTAQVQHPVIQAVQEGNYMQLADLELPMRKELSYPPFSRIIRISLRHKEFQVLKQAANHYGDVLRKGLHDRVLGPQVPPVGKIRNYYIQQFQVKMIPGTDNISRIKQFLMSSSAELSKTDGFKGVSADFDVDPA